MNSIIDNASFSTLNSIDEPIDSNICSSYSDKDTSNEYGNHQLLPKEVINMNNLSHKEDTSALTQSL